MRRIVLSRWFYLATILSLALPNASAARAQGSTCIAHHPRYVEGRFEVKYDAGCTGHDEPELDPVSTAPGSARDLTWTAVLPTGGAFLVSAAGPTFWFGAS